MGGLELKHRPEFFPGHTGAPALMVWVGVGAGSEPGVAVLVGVRQGGAETWCRPGFLLWHFGNCHLGRIVGAGARAQCGLGILLGHTNARRLGGWRG